MVIQIRAAADADLPSILALHGQVEDDCRILPSKELVLFSRGFTAIQTTMYTSQVLMARLSGHLRY